MPKFLDVTSATAARAVLGAASLGELVDAIDSDVLAAAVARKIIDLPPYGLDVIRYGGPEDSTATVVRGSPDYSGGKIATGQVLKSADGIADYTGQFTIEVGVTSPASAPAGNRVAVNVDNLAWLGVNSSGYAILSVTGVKATGTVNICDSGDHVIAAEVQRSVGAANAATAMWVDGDPVAGVTTTGVGQVAFDGSVIIGGLEAGGTDFTGSIDWVRVSRGSLYTAGESYTPADPEFVYSETVFLALLSSATCQTPADGYRDVTPGSRGVFIGVEDPADWWNEGDVWIQQAVV